jgi:hypothetical protein
MRRTIYIPVLATLLSLAAILATAQTGSAADKAKPAAAKPSASKTDPACEKLKALGAHLGRALDIALDLFSGNQADLLSKNKAALLSGNKAALLSGNSANLLSGNAPKVLSENTTPIFSGNTFSLFSNFKVEIHIENSGNNVTPPQPSVVPNIRRPQPNVRQPQPSVRPNATPPSSAPRSEGRRPAAR